MPTCEELRGKFAELSSEINTYQKIIDNISELKKDAEIRRNEIVMEIYEVQREETTKEFLQSVYEINSENSLTHLLEPNTKTIPIMDAFRNTDGLKFLVLQNVFCFPREQHNSVILSHWKVSLIITRSNLDLAYANTNLTLSALKSRSHTYIMPNASKTLNSNSDFYPLIQELDRISSLENKETGIIPFNTPCYIGAQSSKNRTGYGSGYYSEGTLYGEVDTYFIIGVQIS